MHGPPRTASIMLLVSRYYPVMPSNLLHSPPVHHRDKACSMPRSTQPHVHQSAILHSHAAGLAVQVVHPVSYPALAGPAELQAVMQLGCILADQAEQEHEVGPYSLVASTGHCSVLAAVGLL